MKKRFANSRSALYSTDYGAKVLPCPTCKEPNKLNKADVAKGYQCDECADKLEGPY